MSVDPGFEKLLDLYRKAALNHVDEQAARLIEEKSHGLQHAQDALQFEIRASDARQAIANQAKDLILTGDDADYEKGMRLMKLQANSGLDFTRLALGLRATGVPDAAIHDTLAEQAEAEPGNARLQGMLEVSSLVTIQPVEEGQAPHYPF